MRILGRGAKIRIKLPLMEKKRVIRKFKLGRVKGVDWLGYRMCKLF